MADVMTLTTSPAVITIEPTTLPANASVICLHGLGADGSDLTSVVRELALPHGSAVRFLFPHAPYRPVTINNGYRMRAWYDITHGGLEHHVDSIGIAASERLISDLIEAEIDCGVAAERIVLAGFSQGGAVALHTGLRYPRRLAGLIGLSTYLPQPEILTSEAMSVNQGLPILLAHGTQDTIVPLRHASAARAALQDAGYALTWHTYPIAHSLCWEELRHLSLWLQEVLA